MTENERNQIALFRYGVISPLVTNISNYKNKKKFFRDASEKEYINQKGENIRISDKSIETWYYSYMKFGFDALKPKVRNDLGRIRKLDDDLISIINHYVINHPRMPSAQIYKDMIANCYITYNDISVSTINRYVKRLKENKLIVNDEEKRRYEAEHINDIWCCDTTYTVKLTVDGVKKWLYVIAIIDDASRMIVGTDAFFNDNYVNFLKVLKSAVTKYGKPKLLNLDNGAPYKNNQLELLAARVGISLVHNRPFRPVGIMCTL